MDEVYRLKRLTEAKALEVLQYQFGNTIQGIKKISGALYQIDKSVSTNQGPKSIFTRDEILRFEKEMPNKKIKKINRKDKDNICCENCEFWEMEHNQKDCLCMRDYSPNFKKKTTENMSCFYFDWRE